ncbi:MAG: hypothetical protein O2951_18965 [Bacteroidetes bacterium]|nr:hypothetical protein [Bacteroidota bacterium]
MKKHHKKKQHKKSSKKEESTQPLMINSQEVSQEQMDQEMEQMSHNQSVMLRRAKKNDESEAPSSETGWTSKAFVIKGNTPSTGRKIK